MTTDVPDRWDIEADLVSVGSGIGGLSAAIAIHDLGQTAVILEKSEKVGGITAYSYGELWCGANHLQQERGIKDSLDKTREYLTFLSGNRHAPENLEAFVQNSPPVIKYFMEEVGVRFNIIEKFADYYYPDGPGTVEEGRFLEVEPIRAEVLGEWQARSRTSPHTPPGVTHDEMYQWGGVSSMATWDMAVMGERIMQDVRTLGPGLAAYLLKAALIDRKIPCHTSTAAKELITSNGVVIGVRAEVDGKDILIRARKGVVIATSGYDSNEAMASAYERLPEWHTIAFSGLTGDGLAMGAELGGKVCSLPQYATLPGHAIPGESHDGAPLYRMAVAEMGLPHSITVNREGKRFADESFYQEFNAALEVFDRRRQRLKNYPPFLILDQDHRDRYPLGSVMPGQPLPEGFGVQADSLRKVAEGLGVDPDGLEETVERFNGFAREGKDVDFGRGDLEWSRFMWGDLNVTPNPNLGTIARAPFYGFRLTTCPAGIVAAGLVTDGNASVQHVRGRPIPGLYAVGNAAAYLDTGGGYQSGFANTRGMVFGYLAAQHAAKESVHPV